MSDLIEYATKEEIITYAIGLLEVGIKEDPLKSSDDTKKYLKLKLRNEKKEVFSCIFMDNHHKIICYDELFYGSINGAAIYSREVVRAALKHNAAAIICAHNHPSGDCEPSRADKAITKRLVDAMDLIDVRVMDHMIVGDEIYSFVENGLI